MFVPVIVQVSNQVTRQIVSPVLIYDKENQKSCSHICFIQYLVMNQTGQGSYIFFNLNVSCSLSKSNISPSIRVTQYFHFFLDCIGFYVFIINNKVSFYGFISNLIFEKIYISTFNLLSFQLLFFYFGLLHSFWGPFSILDESYFFYFISKLHYNMDFLHYYGIIPKQYLYE